METSVVVCHLVQAVPSCGEMAFIREAGSTSIALCGRFRFCRCDGSLLFLMLAPWQQRQVPEMLVSALEARQAKVLEFGSNLV